MTVDGQQSACVELLEARQLLSASPAAKVKAVAYPNMVGFFSATEKLAAGSSSITIQILTQKNGTFSGTSLQPDGTTAHVTGTVTKKGVVTLTLKETSPKFSTKVVGKIAGDALTGKYTTTTGKHHQAGVFSATHIHAGIIRVGGAVMVATPPQDLSTGAWESDTQIPVFIEQQNLTLPQAVTVDISQSGTSPNLSDAHLSSGPIAAGTVVNVYALHFDVVGSRATNDALEAIGSITVAENIIGIIVLSNDLIATNGILGIAGKAYYNGSGDGLELNPAGGGSSDFITLSDDLHTVSVDLRAASGSDNFRIITAAPATT